MESILNQLIEKTFKLVLQVTSTKSIFAILTFLVISELCHCAPIKWQSEDTDPLHAFPVFGLDAGHPKSWNRVGLQGVYKRATDESLASAVAAQSNNSIAGEDLLKFDLGNATAINSAVTGFIKSAQSTIRDLLISTQSGLLRMIGQVDQGLDRFQKRLQNTSFRLVLSGQKAAAQAYEALPPVANKLIQRLGTPQDAGSRQQIATQLNEVVTTWREHRKQFFDAFEEHELDFHNHFQDRFTEINQYLRVPELPRRQFGWH